MTNEATRIHIGIVEDSAIKTLCGFNGTVEPGNKFIIPGREKRMDYSSAENATCGMCLRSHRRIEKGRRTRPSTPKSIDPYEVGSIRTCLVQTTVSDRDRIDRLATQLNMTPLVVIHHALNEFVKTIKKVWIG